MSEELKKQILKKPTVGELITALSIYPLDMKVVIEGPFIALQDKIVLWRDKAFGGICMLDGDYTREHERWLGKSKYPETSEGDSK